MKFIFLAVSSFFLFNVISNAGDFCSGCPSRGNQGYVHATLMSMDTTEGSITIDFEVYRTAIDRMDDTIRVVIDRKCATDEIDVDGYLIEACAVGCEDLFSGKLCDWIEECHYYSHEYYHWFKEYFTWGQGKLIVYYGQTVILAVKFNFTGLDDDYGTPNFLGLHFKNRNFTNISQGDIFDGFEAIGIEADVVWQYEVAPFLQIELENEGGTIITMQARLYQTIDHEGIYRLGIPGGGLANLIRSGYNTPGWRGIITARPKTYDCDFGMAVPSDNITLTNYRLNVERITFTNDFKLYRDMPNTRPIRVEPIIEPEWIRASGKNEPIAYRRDSNYKMNVTLSCNFTPHHDFQFRLKGVAGRLTTDNYVGHFTNSNQCSINDIVPNAYGSFPDSVGVLDSLKFYWVISKIMGYNFNDANVITVTGPHKVFLTYDKPLLDTVNILGLDKICRYAQNQYIDTMVAKMGVEGVYNEGWRYDPGHTPIFGDPLDVIRDTVGQCADYANLMVNLYSSIGLASHAVVIFNAVQTTNLYYLTWWNDSTNNMTANIWSNWLVSCDGQTAYWDFTYHVVAECNNHFADASLGLYRLSSDYESWWRYYVYPQAILPNPNDYFDAEPPPVEPYYYHRQLYALPYIFPTGIGEYDTFHKHP